MQNRNELVLTGRNLEQLLKKAEAHFGVGEGQLDYKINAGKKSGIFSSLFGKKIEVAIWVKSSKKPARNSKRKSTRNRKDERPKQKYSQIKAEGSAQKLLF